MPAGGPHELSVACDGHSVVVKDVHVGEVWLASGQSNMEWTIEACDLKDDTAALELPTLRMITVSRTAIIGQQTDFKASWQTATPKNARAFSAVGYFFARRLGEELGVTVGIVNSSWGGTLAEAWTSRETLARNPDYAPWMHRYHAKINSREYWEKYVQVDNPYPADPGNQGAAKGWADPEFEDRGLAGNRYSRKLAVRRSCVQRRFLVSQNGGYSGRVGGTRPHAGHRRRGQA